MKKKGVNSLLGYLPAVVIGVGLVGSFFTLQADNNTTKTRVDEIKNDLKETKEEVKDDIDELKKENGKLEKAVDVNKTQQDNIQAQVQQVSEKTDKIYDLLLQIEKKKK